jgi:beta-xylosidase
MGVVALTDLANHKAVWVSDQGDGTYINPIIHADYSDPDVIRVGDDFFLTASSFTNMPGLPILHSRDLVNWKIVSHVVERFPFGAYDRVRHGCGIWAPSLRHNDGKFWVFFGAPDEGIFMSNTTDPFGKWSSLVCVREAKGWIDTCPFWDDDGQAYLVHAYAHSRCGIKHRLAVHRMKPDGTELLDEGTVVFEDPERHPTMEGPKMYKRNGFYYIFAPAGGVKTGWQTVLRSRNVFGPYEDRVVLHQGNTEINGPHQGALVELASGESWFVHFQDKDAYGRVVHLQPVHWVDDWPVMGVNQDECGRGEPVLRYRKPDVGRSYPVEVPATTDYFDGERLGLQWQWQANPNPRWSSLTGSSLRLYSYPIPSEPGALWDAPNLLLQKFPAPCFQATTRLVLHAERPDTYAGLTVMGLRYAYVCLSRECCKYRLSFVLGDSSSSSEDDADGIALETNDVYLRVRVDEGAKCTFSYSIDGESYRPIGSVFEAVKGHWIGAKVGLFCVNRGQRPTNEFGEFHWFVVE